MTKKPFQPFRMPVHFHGGDIPLQIQSPQLRIIQCEDGDVGFQFSIPSYQHPIYYFPVHGGHSFRRWFHVSPKGDPLYPQTVTPLSNYPNMFIQAHPTFYTKTLDLFAACANYNKELESNELYDVYAGQELGACAGCFPGSQLDSSSIHFRERVHIVSHENGAVRETPFAIVPGNKNRPELEGSHEIMGYILELESMEDHGHNRLKAAHVFVDSERMKAIEFILPSLMQVWTETLKQKEDLFAFDFRYTLYKRHRRPDSLSIEASDVQESEAGKDAMDWSFFQAAQSNPQAQTRAIRKLSMMWSEVETTSNPTWNQNRSAPLIQAIRRPGSRTAALAHLFMNMPSILRPSRNSVPSAKEMGRAIYNIYKLQNVKAPSKSLQELKDNGYQVGVWLNQVVQHVEDKLSNIDTFQGGDAFPKKIQSVWNFLVDAVNYVNDVVGIEFRKELEQQLNYSPEKIEQIVVPNKNMPVIQRMNFNEELVEQVEQRSSSFTKRAFQFLTTLTAMSAIAPSMSFSPTVFTNEIGRSGTPKFVLGPGTNSSIINANGTNASQTTEFILGPETNSSRINASEMNASEQLNLFWNLKPILVQLMQMEQM